MPAHEAPNLAGKIIAVKFGSGKRDYCYIEATGFELQDGRNFLVGKTVSSSGRSIGGEGIRFCVAWDVVTAYYEFNSIEECRKALASWYPPRKRFWFFGK